MDPEEVFDGFLQNAQRQWMSEAETALHKIATLRWWERWKSKRIAQEVLGIGPYWNKGFDDAAIR